MGPQHFVIQGRDASSHESLSISLSNWPNSPTPLPSFSPTRCAWWKNGRRVTVIRVQRVRETEYYLMTSSGVLSFLDVCLGKGGGVDTSRFPATDSTCNAE